MFLSIDRRMFRGYNNTQFCIPLSNYFKFYASSFCLSITYGKERNVFISACRSSNRKVNHNLRLLQMWMSISFSRRV